MSGVRARLLRLSLATLVLGGTVVLPAPPAAALTKNVNIVYSEFKPKKVTIEKGDRVKWTNKDGVDHTVTQINGKWDSGILDPGDTFVRKFRVKGTKRYYCTIHGFTGKIVVT